MSIGPGSLRRAVHGDRSLALVLRPLTTDERKKFAYYTEHCDDPAWMTLHLDNGEEVPHGDNSLQDRRFWSNEDV